MSTRLIQKVVTDADLDKLREITHGIVGEVCWRASVSYGDELCLDIGARLPYSQKVMAGKEKGEWILGTRGSAWILTSSDETLASSDEDPDVFKRALHCIEGAAIVAFETRFPDLVLTITFSNGCKLTVFTSNEDNFDLPYWELFTPYDMVLQTGPGAMWSYIRSDVPESP
jgi:hypothetical protein